MLAGNYFLITTYIDYINFIFFIREVVTRTSLGSSNSIIHEKYLCHCYVRNDSLACSVTCDTEYPTFAAFKLIYEVLEQFIAKEFPWKAACQDTEFSFSLLQELIIKYQNPAEIDKLMKVQQNIDDTREVVIKTIDQLLERGQK